MNYKKHNQKVDIIWKRFYEGNPIRMPMIAGVSDRFFLYNKETNPYNISFQQYSNDPRMMFEMQATFDRYRRYHIIGDHKMGDPEPEEEGWSVNIDFQNYYEAVWLGSGLCYPDGEVPFATPILTEENRERFFEKGIPDPFSGLMKTAVAYYERFKEYQKDFVLEGYKVAHLGLPFLGTDGPFTLACELMGAEQMCICLYEDPEYAHKLLDFITKACINRLKAWRKYLGFPILDEGFYFADDSILLLSKEMYQEFVLPYHVQYVSGVSTRTQPGFVHLCGDATRHFKVLKDVLNVKIFDTGFPVNHGALVKELGFDVQIQGGPKAELMRSGTPQAIKKEAKRIIDEVRPYTKKFVLREGNDIPPHTPLENIKALYEAVETFGIY